MRLLTSEDVGFSPPEKEITGSLGEMGKISFRLASPGREEDLWRYLIQSYHYLGYRRVVGRYLKYFVYLGDELVALIGFADGVYHHNLRDRYLGWDRKALEEKRHLPHLLREIKDIEEKNQFSLDSIDGRFLNELKEVLKV